MPPLRTPLRHAPHGPVVRHLGWRYLTISISDLGLVDIAPAPILARFEGLDDWMSVLVEMLPCVPMRRGVAAADVTAGQAQAQMHPPRANSQAILATIGARDDVTDHVPMWVGHFASPPSSNPKHDNCRARAGLRGADAPRSIGERCSAAIAARIFAASPARLRRSSSAARRSSHRGHNRDPCRFCRSGSRVRSGEPP
jgi:hypothetical protein